MSASEPGRNPATEHVIRIRKLYDDMSLAPIGGDEPGANELFRIDLLTSIIESAEKARAIYVARARERGSSWTRIGQNVGTSKQAARVRYGAKPATTVVDGEQLTIDEGL